jgi:polar amino acid transport system substrate-binding protein
MLYTTQQKRLNAKNGRLVMRRAFLKGMAALAIAAVTMGSVVGAASAQSLLEKIQAGETIRIGFSNEIPWAYPGDNNEPLGFVNAMTIDLLERMGTTSIEPIVTEWGALITGIQAGRFDIITGGLYILPER